MQLLNVRSKLAIFLISYITKYCMVILRYKSSNEQGQKDQNDFYHCRNKRNVMGLY